MFSSKKSDYTNYDYIFKYIMIGDSGVGKSSMMRRFIDDKWHDNEQSTIGVEFGTKIITDLVSTRKVKIQIWDTGGQEVFRHITRSYYRNAACVILVYDKGNKKSYENALSWFNDVKDISPSCLFVLVANKIDTVINRYENDESNENPTWGVMQPPIRCVTYEEGIEMANTMSKYHSVSSPKVIELMSTSELLIKDRTMTCDNTIFFTEVSTKDDEKRRDINLPYIDKIFKLTASFLIQDISHGNAPFANRKKDGGVDIMNKNINDVCGKTISRCCI